jgi:hypothetical protein
MKARGPASLLIGLGIEAMLLVPPDWLANLDPTVKSVIQGIAAVCIVIGLGLLIRDRYGLNPRKLWYHF